MKIGTKSLLFGAHQFLLHPIFVFIAWWKLYGFPYDPRMWIAFIVHDWGYWGKPNMDGKEGETHPILGAKIMHKLCDKRTVFTTISGIKIKLKYYAGIDKTWYNFTLYHSRFYAKTNGQPISKLCIADKYATVIVPRWLYLTFVRLTGEYKEYMTVIQTKQGKEPFTDIHIWYKHMIEKMTKYCMDHKDNLDDTTTKIKTNDTP